MNLFEASFFGDFTLTSLIPVIVIAVLAVITVIRRRKKGKPL